MTSSRNRKSKKSLSFGRPLHMKSPASISSKATRTVIRTHHVLQKQMARAVAEGNDAAILQISRLIEAQGGLETYQRASLLGQGKERGGDSSKILMDWLKPLIPEMKDGKQLRMLEIGALSASNSCSRSKLFEVERIDLNSQSKGITQQDFMERPLPDDELSKFDLISLSLVLNFVPDPVTRGEMLRRTLTFLRQSPAPKSREETHPFPSLFLVLPVNCLTNSRYMDETKLEDIMRSLGYIKSHQKLSNKLAYYLWKATDLVPKTKVERFKKTEVRTGKSRNNFAVVLK